MVVFVVIVVIVDDVVVRVAFLVDFDDAIEYLFCFCCLLVLLCSKLSSLICDLCVFAYMIEFSEEALDG